MLTNKERCILEQAWDILAAQTILDKSASYANALVLTENLINQ